jgi:hypothetical protein
MAGRLLASDESRGFRKTNGFAEAGLVDPAPYRK